MDLPLLLDSQSLGSQLSMSPPSLLSLSSFHTLSSKHHRLSIKTAWGRVATYSLWGNGLAFEKSHGCRPTEGWRCEWVGGSRGGSLEVPLMGNASL